MSHEYSIKDLVDAALRSYSFDESVVEGRVKAAYSEVVGEFIVKLTRSVQYESRSHTLRVTLSSPALKNEISYKIGDLISAINRRLGKEEVKKLLLL